MNLGGLFAAIGRALPGYVEGQRKAVEDNWRDLEKYNSVQKGQLNNLYDIATFRNQIDRDAYMTNAAAITDNRNRFNEYINRRYRDPSREAFEHARRELWLNGDPRYGNRSGAYQQAWDEYRGLQPSAYNPGVPSVPQGTPVQTGAEGPDMTPFVNGQQRR